MELAGQRLGFAHHYDSGVPAEERMNLQPGWARMLEPMAPVHSWQRVAARRLECRACGVKAFGEWDASSRRPYTLWAWRNLLWDSRESAVPTCPPSYRRERGVNPRMVVRPDEGVRGVDR